MLPGGGSKDSRTQLTLFLGGSWHSILWVIPSKIWGIWVPGVYYTYIYIYYLYTYIYIYLHIRIYIYTYIYIYMKGWQIFRDLRVLQKCQNDQNYSLVTWDDHPFLGTASCFTLGSEHLRCKASRRKKDVWIWQFPVDFWGPNFWDILKFPPKKMWVACFGRGRNGSDDARMMLRIWNVKLHTKHSTSRTIEVFLNGEIKWG